MPEKQSNLYGKLKFSNDSDGAAAIVLVSGKKALELGLEVIAKIKGYGDAAHVIPDSFITFSN